MIECSRVGLCKLSPTRGVSISVQTAVDFSSNPPSLLETCDFTLGERRPGLIIEGHSGDDRLKAFAFIARDPDARRIETVAVSGIALQHIKTGIAGYGLAGDGVPVSVGEQRFPVAVQEIQGAVLALATSETLHHR